MTIKILLLNIFILALIRRIKVAIGFKIGAIGSDSTVEGEPLLK